MTLEDQILALDDETAEILLLAFSKAQPAVSTPAQVDPMLRRAFETSFDLGSETAVIATTGDLARTALVILAKDASHGEGIAALIATPPPRQFIGAVEAAVLVPAVLIVLQTHVKFERGADGKWSLRLEKKPTDNGLLKDLIRKLLSLP